MNCDLLYQRPDVGLEVDLEGKRRRWSALEREGIRQNDKVTWPPSTQEEMKLEQEKGCMVSEASKEQGETVNYAHQWARTPPQTIPNHVSLPATQKET